MPSKLEIDHQYELLSVNRRNLAILIFQRDAQGGRAYAAISVLSGIDEARNSIRRIKVCLRAWGEIIDDQHNDEDETFKQQSKFNPQDFIDREREQEIFLSLLSFQTRKRFLTIIDGKGSGKSHLLQQLVYLCTNSCPMIPVSHVDITESDTPDSLLRQIYYQLYDCDSALGSASGDEREYIPAILRYCTERPAVVLLDGIEKRSEKVHDLIRRSFFMKLEAIGREQPLLLIVIAGTAPVDFHAIYSISRINELVEMISELSSWETRHIEQLISQEGIDDDKEEILPFLLKKHSANRITPLAFRTYLASCRTIGKSNERL